MNQTGRWLLKILIEEDRKTPNRQKWTRTGQGLLGKGRKITNLKKFRLNWHLTGSRLREFSMPLSLRQSFQCFPLSRTFLCRKNKWEHRRTSRRRKRLWICWISHYLLRGIFLPLRCLLIQEKYFEIHPFLKGISLWCCHWFEIWCQG